MGLEKLLENTPEAYMRIGFIFADGYIEHGKYKRLGLECSIKDEDYVKDFAAFIEAKTRRRTRVNQKLKCGEMISFTIKGIAEIPKLIKKFDFKQKKTYNPPEKLNIKSNDLFVSMFIGYVDGDGSISKNGHLKIKCHYSWKKTLDKWVSRIWKISGCEVVNDKMVIPKARIISEVDPRGLFKRGSSAIINVYNPQFMMFLKSKIEELKLPVLKRKWDRIKSAEGRKRNICEMDKYQNEKDVIKFYKQGMTSCEISGRLGLTQTTINDIKRKNKLFGNAKRKYTWLNWETVGKIREEYKTNTDRMSLCEKYNVSYDNLGAILRNETWNEKTIKSGLRGAK